MKLTEKTINVFKNFSTINNGLAIRPGKNQATVAPEKSILAKAEIDNDFPIEFRIYELSKLLGLLGTLNNPDVEFESTHLVITDDDGIKLNYFYCPDAGLITSPSDREIDMGNLDVDVFVTEKTLTKLIKLASALDAANLYIKGVDGKRYIGVTDRDNDTSNNAEFQLDDYEGDNFEHFFKIENLKIIPNNYNIKINPKGIALFTSEDGTLNYYITLLIKE